MASNTYFKFKEFTIVQEKAAMKVGTDGVLLGAWSNVENASTILDIGTGTGLVALMLAQRSLAEIVAVEVDNDAYSEACQNGANSPWNHRMTFVHTTFQQYARNTIQRFDTIVCNPPFFANSLKAPNEKRTVARHNDTLPPRQLLENAAKLLTNCGRLCIVIPADSESEFRNIAADYRLFASHITRVKPTTGKAAKRVLIEFKVEAEFPVIDELIIETETHHHYTPAYIELVRDFYLAM